ncbi:MAG: hypothetical protein M1828_005272 [Chrysothrix sp. TS-e1954]|nr:MAG: hypothetical protein M1828_005272 [Chrysothrix sp. TS-e1954]
MDVFITLPDFSFSTSPHLDNLDAHRRRISELTGERLSPALRSRDFGVRFPTPPPSTRRARTLKRTEVLEEAVEEENRELDPTSVVNSIEPNGDALTNPSRGVTSRERRCLGPLVPLDVSLSSVRHLLPQYPAEQGSWDLPGDTVLPIPFISKFVLDDGYCEICGAGYKSGDLDHSRGINHQSSVSRLVDDCVKSSSSLPRTRMFERLQRCTTWLDTRKWCGAMTSLAGKNTTEIAALREVCDSQKLRLREQHRATRARFRLQKADLAWAEEGSGVRLSRVENALKRFES